MQRVTEARGPVARRHALVRTQALRVGGLQVLEDDIGTIDVIPCRQTCFEEQNRAVGVGQHDAVEFDGDVPMRAQRVHPCVRVARMTEDRLVLLEPRQRLPLESDQTRRSRPRRRRTPEPPRRGSRTGRRARTSATVRTARAGDGPRRATMRCARRPLGCSTAGSTGPPRHTARWWCRREVRGRGIRALCEATVRFARGSPLSAGSRRCSWSPLCRVRPGPRC